MFKYLYIFKYKLNICIVKLILDTFTRYISINSITFNRGLVLLTSNALSKKFSRQ